MDKANIYLFYGPDTYSINKKVNFWLKEFGKKYGQANARTIDLGQKNSSPDLINEIKSILKSNSLFSNTKLVVLKNFLSAKLDNNLKEYLIDEIEKTDKKTFIIFSDNEIDKRGSIYKKLQQLEKKSRSQIQEFLTPQGSDLNKFINDYCQKNLIEISPNDQKYLSFIYQNNDPYQPISYDLWQVSNDLDKLSAYSKIITKQSIELLIKTQSNVTVFKLADAIINSDKKMSIYLAHQLIDDKDKSSALAVNSFLISQFKNYLLAKDALINNIAPAQVAKSLEWSEKRLWYLTKVLESKNINYLKEIYDCLVANDMILKTNSNSPTFIFDLFIIKKV